MSQQLVTAEIKGEVRNALTGELIPDQPVEITYHLAGETDNHVVNTTTDSKGFSFKAALVAGGMYIITANALATRGYAASIISVVFDVEMAKKAKDSEAHAIRLEQKLEEMSKGKRNETERADNNAERADSATRVANYLNGNYENDQGWDDDVDEE